MTEFFVSTSGKDTDPGTFAKPFRTITHGASVLQAGDILNLRKGVYVELVDIANKHGTVGAPIVIRSFPGEHAFIDGCLPQFRTLPNDDWELAQTASPPDPDALSDEYVSRATFPTTPNMEVNRGAFNDRNPYTRLITYSNLNDLRATNELFDKIPIASPLDGPDLDGPDIVMEPCDPDNPEPSCVTCPDGHLCKPSTTFRYPWVYMGPGIWFNRASPNDSPTGGKVHIRLAHTNNHIDGLADYSQDTDPRNVSLAITPKNKTTLHVHGCSNMRFENLTIRYGGELSIHLENVEGLVFDHVRIRATTFGVRMGNATNTTFCDCEFNGGVPTWYFRSDRKAQYVYKDAAGTLIQNNLGKHTSDRLLFGNSNDTGTQVFNCEFHNGHDVYLIGSNLTFHHNWVNNMNDEGIVVDDAGNNSNMHIYQNVILKTLSAISFSGAGVGGSWFIYRNLVDLRSPTASHRPTPTGLPPVWRFGHLIKSNAPDGPYSLFQNTFLVDVRDKVQALFTLYGDPDGLSPSFPRRSFNNIFFAVNPVSDPASDKAITFIPSPNFPAQTDGNDYFRLGTNTTAPYRYQEYRESTCPGGTCDAGTFECLEACPNALRPNSKIFLDSGSRYEAHSIEENPKFRRIGADGIFRETDDLRLDEASPASPALHAGVMLPSDLQMLIEALDPLAPSGSSPDIGCYPSGSGPLQVGVDRRKSFPG